MKLRNGIPFLHRPVLFAAAGAMIIAACQTPPPRPASPLQQSNTINKEHVDLFGNFDPPKKIGTVENIGLQLPTISPDGQQMLYLRSDSVPISSMTLLGSPDPNHTPPAGTLSIWLRPASGTDAGRQLSSYRWSHSPVWSDSGHSIAYGVNDPPKSFIVHVDLATGRETLLGVPDALNCLPRFDGDDRPLLYCSAANVNGPFCVYRQIVGDVDRVQMTPTGVNCLLPVKSDDRGRVLCARVDGDHLSWVESGLNGVDELVPQGGLADPATMLQTWAGIASPLSPDGRNFMFYDPLQNRIAVFILPEKHLVNHRPRSIAACWLTNEAIALATDDLTFLTNNKTGMSLQLLNGLWIPNRYIPRERRLILLGRQSDRRFSIVEVLFKTREADQENRTY
jgi:hypothetical protein